MSKNEKRAPEPVVQNKTVETLALNDSAEEPRYLHGRLLAADSQWQLLERGHQKLSIPLRVLISLAISEIKAK